MLGNNITNIADIIVDPADLIPHPKSPKNTPFEDLLKLKQKYPQISQRHLGKLVGISRTAIGMMFERHGYNWESGQFAALEEYQNHKADVLAIKQIEVLQGMTSEDIKKAGLRDKVVAFGILHDHERLERGQSTGAIEVNISGLITAVAGPSRGLIRDQPGVIVQAPATIYGGAGNSNDTSNS